MTNNKQQPLQENPNNQFSNNEPMTFAQKVEYVKSTEMTNNKQQTTMKLYTEEQVREIIERAELNQHLTYGDVLDGIFPIELPTDEEIEKESFDLYANHNTYSLNVRQYKAFKRGARWMSNKIQGGKQ